jgi:hypothetical protein
MLIIFVILSSIGIYYIIITIYYIKNTESNSNNLIDIEKPNNELIQDNTPIPSESLINQENIPINLDNLITIETQNVISDESKDTTSNELQ